MNLSTNELNHEQQNMMKFPVDQDPETLSEYRDNFSEQYHEIEHLAIGLETCPEDLIAVQQLHDIFNQLWINSTNLNLVPIVENVAEIVHIFEFMLKEKAYPNLFSEYLLIMIDRLLIIIEDVLHTNGIDMLKVQTIHVSLQKIILSKSVDEINHNIPEALTLITQSAITDAPPLADDFDVVMFDDDDGLFEQDSPTEKVQPILNPDAILAAREYMQSMENDPLLYLGGLCDMHTTHGMRHTQFLHEIALAMNIMEGEPIASEDLWTGICLHDIGLSHLSEVLGAQRKLTPEEKQEIQQHPVIGGQLCEKMSLNENARRVVLEHHERIDGRGYPYGLKKDEITTGGKILAIVDSFHAMIVSRPHKQHTKNILRAITEINSCSGTHYDPRWVGIFNQCIKKFWLEKYIKE